MNECKKLIEVTMPVKEITAESVRESEYHSSIEGHNKEFRKHY